MPKLDKDAAHFWGEAMLNMLRSSAGNSMTEAIHVADQVALAYVERRGDAPFDPSAEFARLFPRFLESAEKMIKDAEPASVLHLRAGATASGYRPAALCSDEATPLFKITSDMESVTCLACLRVAASASWRPGHGG